MVRKTILMALMAWSLSNKGVKTDIWDKYEFINCKAYPTTQLYVRTGPGTEYKEVGTLQKGEEINVIARKGDWSLYEKDDLFVWSGSNYLTEDPSFSTLKSSSGNNENHTDYSMDGITLDNNGEKTYAVEYDNPFGIDFATASFGDHGRFVIPDVGVNVALYGISLYGDSYEYNQAVTDRQDSASYFTDTANTIIADHWNQGFDGIKRCVNGTKAYIVYGDGTYREYVCTGIDPNGTNNEWQILTSGGVDLLTVPDGRLIAYTCNEHWSHITICFFSPV